VPHTGHPDRHGTRMLALDGKCRYRGCAGIELAGSARRAGSIWVWIALLLVGCSTARTGSREPDPGLSRLSGGGGVQPASYQPPGEPIDEASPSWSWEHLKPSRVIDSAKKTAGYGPNPELAREYFDQGEQHYRQAVAARENGVVDGEASGFLDAAARYEFAAKRWPDSALEQDALFRAGECYYFADQYPNANEQYEQLLQKYPNTRYLDLVQARRFSIAQYWLQLVEQQHHSSSILAVNVSDPHAPWRDTYGHALRILDKIPLDDPRGKLADDATLAAGNAYFRARRFSKADQYYSDLRRHFPTSEHQFAAHFLGMKCKLETYQGPAYSGKPLDEAEDLIRQLRRQFPQEIEDRREEINRAAGEVRFRKAEREFYRAEYYDRRWEYGAARSYYDTVIDQYPDTPFAEQSRQRLAEIADRPDTPPQRLTWLVDLFPEPKPAKPLFSTAQPKGR
jgi:outer membrane protein assembly factor BamD (BamD/ComL family)